MCLYHTPAERQPQPRSLGSTGEARVDPVELVEDAGGLLRCETRSLIDDVHDHERILDSAFDVDCCARWRVLCGVLQQVQEKLCQPCLIALALGEALGEIQNIWMRWQVGLHAEAPDHLLTQSGQVERLEGELQSAAAEPRQIQEIVDQE